MKRRSSSSQQKRGTKKIFFYLVSFGLDAQLPTLLWCLSSWMFGLSGSGLCPPTQTSLQSGSWISSPEGSKVLKIPTTIQVILKLEVPLESCSSKFSPWTRSISIPWVLVEMEDYWILLQMFIESELLGVGPGGLDCNKLSGWLWCTLNFLKPWHFIIWCHFKNQTSCLNPVHFSPRPSGLDACSIVSCLSHFSFLLG